MRTYYLKPPNISWGALFPFALILAFTIRQPGEMRDLVPGLLGMTVLFGTTSMEAIVITFERRIGALERLMLAPISLPALLLGKVLGGMVFGLVTTVAILAVAAVGLGLWGANWSLLSWLLSFQMSMIYVQAEQCTECEVRVKVCPAGASQWHGWLSGAHSQHRPGRQRAAAAALVFLAVQVFFIFAWPP